MSLPLSLLIFAVVVAVIYYYILRLFPLPAPTAAGTPRRWTLGDIVHIGFWTSVAIIFARLIGAIG